MIPAYSIHRQQAMKINGAFVRIESTDFLNILKNNEELLVIESKTGIFLNTFLYLTSCKGFIWYCKSKEQLSIPTSHEIIFAQHVSLPPM